MSIRYRPDRNKYEASIVIRGRRQRPLFATKRLAEEAVRLAKLKKFELNDVVARMSIGDGFRIYSKDVSEGKVSKPNDTRYFNLAHHFFISVRGLEFLNDISLQDLEALQKWLLKEQILDAEKKEVKEEWRASTVNRAFHTYGHFFSKMCAWGKLQKNPAEYLGTLPVLNVDREPLTREIYLKMHKQIEKEAERDVDQESGRVIRRASPIWFKDVLDFLYFTGARGSSVARLTWPKVDLKARILQLDSHKGAKAETKIITLPITDPIFALLVRVRNRWPDATGAVFRYGNGEPIKADRISKVGNRLIKACGYPEVDLYGSRHALASELTDAGVQTEVVRQLLGHSNIRTTQTYAKGTSSDTLAKALNLVRREEVPPDATSEKTKIAVGSGDSE